MGTHEEIQFALRDVDDDADVDVHEAGLNHEEYRLAGMERFWLGFAII